MGLPVGVVGAAPVVPQRDTIELEQRGVNHDASREASISGSTLDEDGEASSPSAEHVDVSKAEGDFAVSVAPQAMATSPADLFALASQALTREFSRRSSHFRSHDGEKDLEAEGDDASEDFNLLAYLRNEEAQYDAAGFKRKVVGVSWDKLNVTGSGGMKVRVSLCGPLGLQLFADFATARQMNIRTFPDAVKEAVLWPLIKFFQITKTGPFKLSPINILHEFDGCLKPGEMCLVLGRPGSG